MFLNSNALFVLLANMSITQLMSISVSQLIFKSTKSLSRCCRMNARKYTFNLFNTLPERLHSQEVSGNLAHICNNVCQFEYRLLLQTCKTLTTDAGHTSLEVSTHLLFPSRQFVTYIYWNRKIFIVLAYEALN